MEARLTKIHTDEVLLYLGYKGGTVPPDLQAGISRCQELLLSTARPRVTYRQFPIMPDGSLGDTGFIPAGNDVKALLRECDQAVLMCATLGAEAEALIRRWQVRDMAEALILDCCGSSAIENVCDNFCEDLQRELAPRYLTDRFSPGYGDLPFAQQPDFCRILDISRRIGVTLSPSGLMIPQKSVTALIGISDRPQTKRFRGCAFCSNFHHCSYRKEDKTCGQV